MNKQNDYLFVSYKYKAKRPDGIVEGVASATIFYPTPISSPDDLDNIVSRIALLVEGECLATCILNFSRLETA